MRKSLSVVGERPEIPLYTGSCDELEEAVRTMTRKKAEEIGGKLSHPSKMDCPAWGIPAKHCKTGAKLAEVEGSTCSDCYALKGSFTFPNVKKVLADNYDKLLNVLWVPAMVAQIRWEAEDRFRWFVAGDIQSANNLKNIIRVCEATRHILHWLPTREGATVKECSDLVPDNLTIRLSATMVDGPPPTWWPTTSTVVSAADLDTCPSSTEGKSCADHECTACWDREVANVAYLKH